MGWAGSWASCGERNTRAQKHFGRHGQLFLPASLAHAQYLPALLPLTHPTPPHPRTLLRSNQPPCGQLKPEEGAGIAVRLLQEMVGLFPNSIFSTGADEVNFNCWHGSVVPKNSSEYAEFQGASLKKLQTFQSKASGSGGGGGGGGGDAGSGGRVDE